MSCDEHCDASCWEVIGLGLLESKPRYPSAAILSSSLCILSGLWGIKINSGLRLWGDGAAITIGLAFWIYLSLRYRRQMRKWDRGVESYRKMTGKDPGEEFS